MIKLRNISIQSPFRAMIVCLCHRVSDRDIRLEVVAGTRCFERLQDDTRVASSCGSCLDCAREVFDSACACLPSTNTRAETPLLATA